MQKRTQLPQRDEPKKALPVRSGGMSTEEHPITSRKLVANESLGIFPEDVDPGGRKSDVIWENKVFWYKAITREKKMSM